ncbi:LCP family protein [Clostridium thermarum]|uniref:LCP family protein n=1 Tax=Clostridium thermarum TaxID=1716543 RepID=UPI001FAE0BEE|nr:LCP family protein [Clostridium thermarum]
MRKRKKLFIALGIIFSVIAVAIISVSIYMSSMLNKIEREVISDDPQELGISPEVTDKIENTKDSKRITNILLFGIDQTEGKRGRSDSILILTIDEAHNKVKVSSIMRDSYVNIDGRGMDKINHAYAFGGPQLAIKTINSNYKLNIKDYISVNFTTLPELIDTLGGVEITIKDYEISQMEVVGITEPGKYNLTGKQALKYSRIRYVGNGDYERTERHRTILEKVFNKLIKLNPTEIPNMMSKLLPMMKTNMTNGEILDLGKTVLSMGTTKLEQKRFPLDGYCEGKMINGIWYLVFDQEATNEQIYQYIFEDKEVE